VTLLEADPDTAAAGTAAAGTAEAFPGATQIGPAVWSIAPHNRLEIVPGLRRGDDGEDEPAWAVTDTWGGTSTPPLSASDARSYIAALTANAEEARTAAGVCAQEFELRHTPACGPFGSHWSLYGAFGLQDTMTAALDDTATDTWLGFVQAGGGQDPVDDPALRRNVTRLLANCGALPTGRRSADHLVDGVLGHLGARLEALAAP
jgi:hypothetical protein